MTTLNIVELEAVINRCRSAMLPTPGVLAQFNALATLYATLIYEHRQSIALADMDDYTRRAALAYMPQADKRGSGVVSVLAPGSSEAAATKMFGVSSSSVPLAEAGAAESVTFAATAAIALAPANSRTA